MRSLFGVLFLGMLSFGVWTSLCCYWFGLPFVVDLRSLFGVLRFDLLSFGIWTSLRCSWLGLLFVVDLRSLFGVILFYLGNSVDLRCCLGGRLLLSLHRYSVDPLLLGYCRTCFRSLQHLCYICGKKERSLQ